VSSDDQAAANREAANSGRTLKDFFKLVDTLRTLLIDRDFDAFPPSYDAAFRAVNETLDTFISDAEAGRVTLPPGSGPILKFENDMLKKITDNVKGTRGTPKRSKWFFKWFKKGCKAADIIIRSLEKNVPGLSFVGEFKDQIDNVTPEG
jgi:hypothetical protein